MACLRHIAAMWTMPFAVVAVLAACTPLPPPPPLLALARTDCEARPDFASALPVRTEDRWGTPATMGDASRCLDVPGMGLVPYVVFALPDGPAAYTLEILSSATRTSIVRPVAMLYDAAGQPVRTVPSEEFEPNIRGLRAGVRPHGTERWLVVMADRSQLGQPLHLKLGDRGGEVQVAATVFVPVVIIPPEIPDFIRRREVVVALNGHITVSATAMRTVQ